MSVALLYCAAALAFRAGEPDRPDAIPPNNFAYLPSNRPRHFLRITRLRIVRSPSLRAMMQRPSCLISWSKSDPAGDSVALVGKLGAMSQEGDS
jgi:hypothetical protein